MQQRIYLSPPDMGGEELQLVQEAFATNWISPAGPHIDAFERKLSSWSGVRHTAALSSGTAAIHLALLILGVERGDEVLCSSFTFAGSCNPIIYAGATPIFIDSERDTWNMDPHFLEEAIKDRLSKGKKPKAIIVVHLYGMPAQMDKIQSIAKTYEIPIIEDAAEALGSTYREKKAGSLGELGVYSFNGNKIITTSGGGSLQSENENWIKKARFLATQARDHAPYYQHSEIGYNYRLSNICAGIGIGQMNVLEQRVKHRRLTFETYKREFEGLGLEYQPEGEGSFSNRWLSTILLNTENQRVTAEMLRIKLEESNIESRPLWKPMHLQPVYAGCMFYGGEVSETLFLRGLCLPSGSSLKPLEQGRIISIVRQYLTQVT